MSVIRFDALRRTEADLGAGIAIAATATESLEESFGENCAVSLGGGLLKISGRSIPEGEHSNGSRKSGSLGELHLVL